MKNYYVIAKYYKREGDSHLINCWSTVHFKDPFTLLGTYNVRENEELEALRLIAYERHTEKDIPLDHFYLYAVYDSDSKYAMEEWHKLHPQW